MSSFSSRKKMKDCREQLDDLSIETLFHLPVKSLLRLRCVAKSWCAFISSPTFANNHFLKRQHNDTKLLVRRYLPRPENIDVFSIHDITSPELEQVGPNIPFPYSEGLFFRQNGSYIEQNFETLGPHNGLFCIWKSDFLTLFNPALREFKRLPPCPFACQKGFSNHIIAEGFGCSDTNILKVILIRRIMCTSKYDYSSYNMVHLYNLNTNSWRIIDGDTMAVENTSYHPSAELFFNGVYHWHATFSYELRYAKVILVFNISTEIFGQLRYPDCIEEIRGSTLSFKNINNSFAMLVYHEGRTEPQLIDIWVMKEYRVSESWTKLLVVGPYQVITSLSPWENDEWLLVESGDAQLVTCAIHTDEVKRFPIYGVEKTLRTLIYKESLISLNQITGTTYYKKDG